MISSTRQDLFVVGNFRNIVKSTGGTILIIGQFFDWWIESMCATPPGDLCWWSWTTGFTSDANLMTSHHWPSYGVYPNSQWTHCRGGKRGVKSMTFVTLEININADKNRTGGNTSPDVSNGSKRIGPLRFVSISSKQTRARRGKLFQQNDCRV